MAARDEDVLATDAGTVDTVEVPAALRGLGALVPGQIIDHYAIEERIGQGGLGEVYRAVDQTLRRAVAIKIMRPSADQDRLLAEAQAAATLAHPNIVVVHEAGIVDGRVFIAMEYVDGATLRTWLTPARTWREIVAIYVAAGRGLVALHEAGLVHRDVKPENVLVGADGRPRVADLGLAARERDDSALLGGTPRYMAPEQRAGVVDARSDQFGFAVALWEALAGAPPFDATTADERRAQIERGPADGGFPSWIRAALERALRANPDERWPTLAALLGKLDRDPRVRRRRIALALGAVALAGAALGAGLALRGDGAIEVCESSTEHIARAWRPIDPTTIRAHFVVTRRQHAAATADRVRDTLDRYAGEWRDERRAVCLASARHEQTDQTAELRVRCLDRLADQVRALVEAFERDADPATVDRATSAVAAIGPVTGCADPKALADIAPPTPAQAARVEALDKALEANQAAYRLGKFAAGTATARDLVAQARAIGYAPQLAATLLHLALYEATLQDGANAERDYTEAIAVAGDAHDDHVTNVAWRHLVDLAVEHHRFDVATDRLTYARAAAARTGYQPSITSDLDLAETNLWYTKGDFARALQVADRAGATIARAKLTPLDHASVLNWRARILHQLHRDAEALAAMREAFGIWERTFGPDHPNIAGSLLNIATAEFGLRQLAAAKRDVDRSIAMSASIYGTGSQYYARGLNNRCELNLSLHAIADAQADCDRALAIKTAREGPDSVEVTTTLQNLAAIAARRGDPGQARSIREHILAINVKAFGDNHPRVARALYDLGDLAQVARDYPTARTLFERGARTAAAIHDPVLLAEGASHLADVYRALRLPAQARDQLRIALTGYEELDRAHQSPDFAIALAHDRVIDGQLDRDAGALSAAETKLRAALAALERVVGDAEPELVEPIAELGPILRAEHQAHAAVAIVRRGIAIADATGEPGLRRAGLYAELAHDLRDDGDQPGALAAAQTARSIFATLAPSPAARADRASLEAWLAARR